MCCLVASHVQLFVIPSPGLPHHFSEFAQGHVHWISDAVQTFHPLSPSSPSVFPSIRVFPTELALYIRWPKYWSFSFNISPSNEYSGWTSFRINWFDLFTVQVTLKSFFQPHSAKASILWHSAFYTHTFLQKKVLLSTASYLEELVRFYKCDWIFNLFLKPGVI